MRDGFIFWPTRRHLGSIYLLVREYCPIVLYMCVDLLVPRTDSQGRTQRQTPAVVDQTISAQAVVIPHHPLKLTQSDCTSTLSASTTPPTNPLFLAKYSTLLGKYTASSLVVLIYRSSASRVHGSSRTMGKVILRPEKVTPCMEAGRECSAAMRAERREDWEIMVGSKRTCCGVC